MIRLFNDEGIVRAAARRRSTRPSRRARGEQVAERFFDVPVSFRDFSDFEQRMMRPTYVEHRIDDAKLAGSPRPSPPRDRGWGTLHPAHARARTAQDGLKERRGYCGDRPSGRRFDVAMSYLDDPRVLFAAERTLLAWQRTAIALMGFGFVVERFGLFLRMVSGQPLSPSQRGFSLWLGVGLLVIGAGVSIVSALQYRTVLRGLGAAGDPARLLDEPGRLAQLPARGRGAGAGGALRHQQLTVRAIDPSGPRRAGSWRGSAPWVRLGPSSAVAKPTGDYIFAGTGAHRCVPTLPFAPGSRLVPADCPPLGVGCGVVRFARRALMEA